ncbi:hypothetical protein D9M72_611300 [compost metagenome]
MSDRSIFFRVEVPPLFRFEELSADSDRWLLPSKPSHDITGACLVLLPTRGKQIKGNIKSISTSRDCLEPLEGKLSVVTSRMELSRFIGASHRTSLELESGSG